MKIIYYSPHPNLNLNSPSGYGTHMREMIGAFEKLGHEVFPLIAGGEADSGNAEKSIESRNGKKLLKQLIPSLVWESLKDYRLLTLDKKNSERLKALIKKAKPDLIYERGNYLQKSGVETAKKFGVKHILEVNAPYIEERENLQGKSMYLQKAKKVEMEKLKKTNGITVVSSALQKYFEREFQIPAQKIMTTPNAINPEKIIIDRELKNKLVNELDLNEKLVIGFVGSIFPYHGVDILIKAFACVAENENLKLLIVGDGAVMPELKKMAAEKGIVNRVVFTGNISHEKVFTYLDLMDICVMAKSNWYGSPVKIFEYGAMEKAIVAPDNIPVKDVLKHNVNALLIDPSVEQLKGSLQKLIEDEDLRRVLAANARKKVMENYTWEKTAASILNNFSE